MLNGAVRLVLERQEDLARAATMEQAKTLPELRIQVMMLAIDTSNGGPDAPFRGVKCSSMGMGMGMRTAGLRCE